MTEQERKPPVKIRITKLQEAQLAEVAAIDAEAGEIYAEIGVGPELFTPRNDIDLGRMTRDHDILVAEGDDHVAGFLIWADQAPGVAFINSLHVDPDHQRLGVGTRLLRELGERATAHGIGLCTVAIWEGAAWAMSFLAVRGFQPYEAGSQMPSKLLAWLEANEDSPHLGPRRQLWWAETDGLGTIPGLPRPDSVR